VRGGGLAGLDLDLGSWIGDAQSEDGPGDTERITGKLDVGAAMADLARLASQRLPADIRQRLVESVSESSVEVVTGRKDRLLRKLRVRVTLTIPREAEAVLGSTGRAKLEFDADLAKVNQPVRVDAPR
jgi:hypothetical protein